MCESGSRQRAHGKFKSGWRHTVKRTLRNQQPKGEGVNTSSFIPTANKSCPLGEHWLSSTQYTPKKCQPLRRRETT